MKQFESFGLDTSNECLWHDGEQLALPPKPFAVLRYLVDHPGRLITHDELLDALWPETYVQPQVLRTYVLELRKLLGDDAASPRFIQTLPKRGYCFVASVIESGTSTHAAPVSQIAPEPSVSPIVDRESELARLNSIAQGAFQGQRQIIFVTGEAGIGKSALVDAFCRQFRSSAAIGCGQCIEGLGKREPYYPLMEALGQLCSGADGKKACEVLAKIAPSWLPSRSESNDSNHNHSASQRTAGDLCAALDELALQKPLILMFEDLHWADDSTLELLSALARRRSSAKLMVVTTCREQAVLTINSLKILKQDLLRRRLATEFVLSPLQKDGVAALLARQLQQELLPDGLAAFVYRHSEGNPLFVIAILEHLIAQQVLVRDELREKRRWHQTAPFPEMETGVPTELAQIIELEVERLTPVEQSILEAASLMSIAFPAWAVAAALQQDPMEIEEKCDDLARRLYFVHRAGSDELPDGTQSAFYVFAHALYREVLYQRQSVSRRSRRHIRIAERLGVLFQGREADVAREMATHFESGCDWLRAANALRAAASRARERQSFAEEVELLEHALRLARNLTEGDRGPCAQEIHGELAKVGIAQA